MREMQSSTPQARNPITHAIHRREVFWQIIVPFVIAVIVFLGFAALTIFSATQGPGGVSRWGEISTIWLVLLAVLPTLIIIAIFGGLVYLVTKALQAIPPVMLKIQSVFALIQEKVHKAADAIAKPVIKTNSFIASLQKLRQKLLG